MAQYWAVSSAAAVFREYRSQLTKWEVRTCVIRFVECGIDDDIMLLVIFGFDLSEGGAHFSFCT
jgi:hypothetical protein